MKRGNRSKTIYFKILIPLMIITFIQIIVILLILYFGIAGSTLNSALVDNYKANVNVRKNYIESSMHNKWANIDSNYDSIIDNTKQFLEKKNITPQALLESDDYSKEYLLTQADILPNIITKNQVTNSFIILNNAQNKEAIFLSTKNPTKEINKEIDVLFAPYDVVMYYYGKEYGLSTNVFDYSFADLEDTSFFDRPIEYALKNNIKNEKSVEYWSCDLVLDGYDVLTYSIPIIYDGNVLGVIGIGLTDQYIQTLLSQLNKGDNLNIALIKKNKNNEIVNSINTYMDYSIPKLSTVTLRSTSYSDIYSFDKNGIEEFYYEDKLSLYDEIMIDETWYIVGILPANVILGASNLATKQVLLVYLLSFLISFILLLLITNLIAKPIKRVSRNISEKNISNIPKTNIYEVDVLLSRLSLYFEKSISVNTKINRLIEDSNISIALAEYTIEDNSVSVTSRFYSMLGLCYSDDSIDGEEFNKRLKKILVYINESSISLNGFKDFFKENAEFSLMINNLYLKLRVVVSNKGAIMTLIDLTGEYEEKKKIEYERDYDVLTGLLNRRGLYNKVTELMSQNNHGALYMIDIDNLKKINDEYGHEFGDKYLKLVGDYLLNLSDHYSNLYVSHISGDEFVLYLNNPIDLNIEKISEEITRIKTLYLECHSKKIYVSLSCGVAVSEDGISFDELRRRADFTMYTVKRTGKNKLAYFDSDAYRLYNTENIMREKLNDLIANCSLDYAYQPIVDIHTGEILGYEALMRPKVEEFKCPLAVIEYAKKYNKLYDIEYITIFKATEKYLKYNCNKKLFINSISSQILSDKDFDIYRQKYENIFSNIVVEIIEEDFGENGIIDRKTNIFRKYNVNYAIDDYGTGFNNIGMILDYTPRYIKLEGSLVRGIDKDSKKLQFTRSIINFCKENNILVIAESVETIEELKAVKSLGADYVQGYLVAKPNLEIKDISDEMKKLVREA